MNKVSGVYAAVLTPFTADLAPNPLEFTRHCEWLLQNGCNGLAPFGTTGEGVSLSVEQKVLLIEAAADANLPMGRLIAGSGTSALGEAVSVAKAVARNRCQGVLCLPPFYYQNPGEDGLFGFFSELIQRVADDRLRLFLYHFPQMSAVPITLSLVERLLATYPDVVVGLKDSSGDWSNTQTYLKEFPGFQVFSGSEELLLENLNAGGAGCISASVNVTARLTKRVFDAWQKADKNVAQRQKMLSELRIALQAFPMVPALKAITAQATGDPDWLNMLPPMVPLSAVVKKTLDVEYWLSELELPRAAA